MVAKRFSLAVKAVVLDDQGRSLLLRRCADSKYLAGCWEWPGGKVDAGEDFAAAVVRETREETALEVEITGLAGATQLEMAAIQVILLCLETRVTGGQVKLSREHEDFAWVPPAAWGRYHLPPRVGDFMLEYAQKKSTKP